VPLDAVRSEVRRLGGRGVTRIGAIGFSTGGHLAGLAALSGASRPAERIDLAVLGYAITSMEMAYRPARLVLLSEHAPPHLRRATSLDALVTSAAPPFFIWHTADDPYVDVEHSHRLGAALAAHALPHALHVFSQGPHSLGLAHGGGEASAWTGLAADWLMIQLDILEGHGR
jgi:acetyl esterase/lipase